MRQANENDNENHNDEANNEPAIGSVRHVSCARGAEDKTSAMQHPGKHGDLSTHPTIKSAADACQTLFCSS